MALEGGGGIIILSIFTKLLMVGKENIPSSLYKMGILL
jgi:hypothetical protein